MANDIQHAETTPLEPTRFEDAYMSLINALQEMKRLSDQAIGDVEGMCESLHKAYGYMEKTPMPENIEKTTTWAMEDHKAQLDELGIQVKHVQEVVEIARCVLDDCVTFADDMREFDTSAEAWGQLEEAKRGLKEASSEGRASSVIEKLDEAMKQLKYHALTAFLYKTTP